MAAEEWTPVEIRDFSGGMRKDKSPIELADNELRYAMNALLDERGAIKKRPGYAKLDSAAIAADVVGVDNVYRFYTSSGAYTVISCETTTYNKIYYYDGSTYTEITGGTALAAGTHVEFQAYGDYLFIANGSQFQYWTGSGAKADCGYLGGSVSVVPKIMAICDDRLFAVTNVGGERFIVFFTEAGVFTTNPTDINFVSGYDLTVPNKSNDGNGINALWAYGDNDELLVLADTNAYTLDGFDDTDYQLRQISRVAGGVSPMGVTETDDGLVVFVGNENVYAFDGGRIIPIGDAIKPALVGMNLEAATCEYVPQWRSVIISHRNGTFVWHVPSGLRSAFSTKSYWDIGGWTEFSATMSSIVRYTKRGENNKIVFGMRDRAYLYTFDSSVNQDDAVNFEFAVQTKTYTLGPFMQTKECRQVWAMCNTQETEPFTVGVSRLCAYDGTLLRSAAARVKLSGPLWDVVYWDQFFWADDATAIAIADHADGVIGNAFSVDLRVTDENALTIYAIGLQLKLKERH